jgi:hypothetical protein
VDRLTPRRAIGRSSFILMLFPAAFLGDSSSMAAADASVAGRVVAAGGTPAAGVNVRVVQTDTSSFQLPLFAPRGPTREITQTVAGADGRYSSRLPGAYVAGSETDADWIVSATKPAAAGQTAGPTSSFEFEVNTAVQEAPDLPLWESTPRVSVDGYRADIAVPPDLPSGPAPFVYLGDRWAKGASASFDLRVLELAAGAKPDAPTMVRGVAYADVTVAHRDGRTIYHQVITSPAVAAPALPPLVPPSRGSPCTVTFADGRTTDAQPCPATDGDLSASVSPSQPRTMSADGRTTTTLAGVRSVTVNLTAPVDVESVFVRNCSECTVEVSADGSTWARPRKVDTIFQPRIDFIAVARFTRVPGARFVRVGQPETASFTEVSVWPARPPGSPSPADEVAAPVPATARSTGVALVAAVLLGVVTAGTAVVARRARRTT